MDILNIDQWLSNNLTGNPKPSITNALISMAYQMNLKLIAEVIKTDEKFEFLCRHNFDEIQVYLFSKSISTSEF